MSTEEPVGDPGPDAISLVVVDDDPMVRAALGMMLGGDSGITVVAEAGDGEEALSVVPASGADVVLMDIRMPVRDGLSATEELLGAHPDLKIIVLTTFDTDDMVLRALRTGAAGFLLKDTKPARLVEAIRTVAAGQPMLSPSVTAQRISGGSAVRFVIATNHGALLIAGIEGPARSYPIIRCRFGPKGVTLADS